MLHSLTLLAQQDLAPTAVLEQVTTELDRDGLDTAETDHYDTLVAQLHRRHGPGPPATV